MTIRLAIFIAVLILGGLVVCEAGPKKKAAVKEQQATELSQVFAGCFQKWDRNHDGMLSLGEINAQIKDPQVRGDEAAAVVAVRRHFAPKGDEDFQGLSRAQLLAFANDAEAGHSFSKVGNRIKAVNHALFLPGDPNLMTFHQGGVGDCYLLSVIGAQVHRDPQAVREMIKPSTNGGYEVHFASGKVVPVSPLTDAELVMGAREGSNRGIWLAVLEKAYAGIREEKRDQRGATDTEDDKVTKDFLGGGGAGKVIALLTGHISANVPVSRGQKLEPQKAVEQFRTLLTDLTRERRLMAVGTGKNPDKPLPKHLPHGHMCGVLGYDPARQMVRLFNPWGNDVKPDGPSGIVNGYATRDGVFDVPIQEFVQIFGGLTYETEQTSGD